MAAPVPVNAGGLPDFDALWDFQHPDSTEAAFLAILPAAREAAAREEARTGPAAAREAASAGDGPAREAPARGYLVELLTQIARTQGLQRRFDDAHGTLDEAQSLLRADLERARVRTMLERGRVFNSSGRREEARPHFADAWELARASGEDGLAVDAAHMIAIVETPENALAWNLDALALAEASSDPKAGRWRGSLYNNIGWTYHDMARYDEALEHFRKGESWRREQGQARETRIATWSVARCLRSLGRVDEALALQYELAKEWAAAGEPDGYVPEEIGECLLALGRAGEARPYFAEAYTLLSNDPWLGANEPERLRRLARLGGVEAP